MNSAPLIECRGQRILVTGGAGFVGSHIVDALHTAGHHVLVVDNLSTGRVTNVSDGTPFALLDIADSALWPVMQQFRPAAVVHAAAQASVPVSVGLPQADARANILGTINLLQASLAAGVEQFTYVNTGVRFTAALATSRSTKITRSNRSVPTVFQSGPPSSMCVYWPPGRT